MCGVTRVEKLKNVYIRGSKRCLKSTQMRENRNEINRACFEHRRDGCIICKEIAFLRKVERNKKN